MLSFISLFSFDALHVKAEILSHIAHELVKKDVVNIYIDDKKFIKTKGLISSVKYTSCQNADVIFISKKETLNKKCNSKYLFTTSYYLYQSLPDVIGVFFWQKGRPNIIIKSSMIKKLNISLSESFKKYVE